MVRIGEKMGITYKVISYLWTFIVIYSYDDKVMEIYSYPLVNVYIAIENGHRNSGFSH